MSTTVPNDRLRRPHDGQVDAYSAVHAAQGIACTLIEVFAVGPYKYTNLEDAIARANRGSQVT